MSANTDPNEFLRELGQMAGFMGTGGGGGATDEVSKLAEAFKLTEAMKPGEPLDPATAQRCSELLEASPYMKSKVEEAMNDPKAMQQMMKEHPQMQNMMQEAQHLIQQDPQWPEMKRKLEQAQRDPHAMQQLRAELQQQAEHHPDPETRRQIKQEIERLPQMAEADGGAAPAPAPAPAPVPAPAPAAEHTPTHAFADGDGGALVLRVELPEVSSMAAVELDVSSGGLSLRVLSLYQLSLEWPRPVKPDGAKAKFLKKSGVLQVTLPPAAGVVV